ncbi:uncharacterized protein IL334_000618 [Kwoniella shivajii]|uniref:non-specific serine/threonine protein kinase n=1 Tax=Kwoniella shivajii TaxID=564305 RepID=A0ABZ1CR61_9TREE|nr:hypothetical protein IL334_000618 [Kwoniella shivajii]
MAAVASRHEDPSGSSSRQPTISRKKTSGSSSKDDAKMIGQWRIGRTIGKGSSGRVKIAKHSVTGKYAAIKIVPKGLILTSRMSMSEAGARADKVLLGIEREIVIMKLIDHPNVLNLYDVWETSSELYLIMEYVPGGELFDYLVKRGRLPISEALHYFQQIILAVDYCHRFNICHRDLKPENLLLDKDKNIKVADFGMAAWEAGERMLETSCGSPHYASPEIVAGKAYHGSSSDIWSCGIILFALLTGRLPFDDDNIRSLLQKVKIGVFEMPDEIKDPARNLLSRMLEKDPERRITMPDILQHPFFVSRPVRPIPGRSLVSPPSLNEVERPVNSPDEIDADIMGNLKTLWSGATDDEIITALMSREKTWEKAIYHLLIKYRNKHLENYNMDDEEDVEARARRHARKAQVGSPAKRKGGPPTQVSNKPKLAPLGENDTIENTPVIRPQAPTPKKALGQSNVAEDSPVSQKINGKLAPVRSPIGPRPPLSNRASSNDSSSVHQTPAIVLQEATPTKDMPPPDFVPSSSNRPRSEILSSPTLPGPETPQLPPINAPTIANQTLQHFFNEVAAQLNTMNIRSSVASNSSTTSSAILGTDYQSYLAFAGGATPNSNGMALPPMEEGAEQFADADDDETEADVASIHSNFTASGLGGPTSPLVGLGLGGPPPPSHGGRPGLYPLVTPGNNNTQRWSYASSTGSSHRGTSGGSYVPVESPQIYSPNPSINVNLWDNQLPHPVQAPQPIFQAERPAPIPPPRANRPTPITRTTVPSTPAPQTTESLLPRDASYVIIDGSDMASDPSISSWSTKSSGFRAHRGSDGFGMLKKKSKTVSIDPVPFGGNNDLLGPASATPSFASTSGGSMNGISPKRSWFNNLFSFKAPACTLLAHDNISSTRDRVRKILTDQGVRVALVEMDGIRGLKCRLDEIRDPVNGNQSVVKGVRFKIEFSRANQGAGQSYNTLVTLTLEKGAQSSFRSVFGNLKQHIESSNPIRPTSTYVNRSPIQPSSATIPSHPQPLLSAPPVRWTSSAPTTPVVQSSPRFGDQRTNLPTTPQSVQIPSSIRF